MKEELIEKIVMAFSDLDIELSDLKNRLYIVMNDYRIEPAQTALVTREENKNEWLLKKFIISKTVKGCTERTIEYYGKEISKTLMEIGKPADQITTDDILYHLAVREKRDGVSKTTLDNTLRCLKTFFTYLVEEDIVRKNPAMKIGKIKGPKVRKEAFTEIEVEKIRQACNNSKDLAIVEILLSTGCRLSELVQIKLTEVKGNKIVVHGKGGKDRIVYLNAKALLALQKYMNVLTKTKNPYLFPKMLSVPEITKKTGQSRGSYMNAANIKEQGHMDKSSVEQAVRRVGKRAGVEKAHPHKFRRTCATFALRRGMPLLHVSKMLGHEQVSTTQIYLDLNERDLEAAHEKYVI